MILKLQQATIRKQQADHSFVLKPTLTKQPTHKQFTIPKGVWEIQSILDHLRHSQDPPTILECIKTRLGQSHISTSLFYGSGLDFIALFPQGR